MTQYSLFGAAAAAPEPADLDGLLLAGAQWVRSGSGARLSVLVADSWRAQALADAFAVLGMAGPDAVLATPGGYAVRTAFDESLVEHAVRWTRGARQGLPDGFQLGAGGLRMWAIAAGHRDDTGYLLATAGHSMSQPDDPMHRAAGAQLARLGVAALSLTRRGGHWRPSWRITSARRLRRLVELVGPPPDGGADAWPGPLPASARAADR